MSFGDFLSNLAGEAIKAGGNALIEKVLPGSTFTGSPSTKMPVEQLTYEQKVFKDFVARNGARTISEAQEDLKDLINAFRRRSFSEGSEEMREMCIDAARQYMD